MVAYITELDSIKFDKFINNGICLVDFYGTWCNPCKQIEPIIDQISIDYLGKLSVAKLDIDKSRELVDSLGIRSIPTILLYKNGEVVEKIVGGVTKKKITDAIDNCLTLA